MSDSKINEDDDNADW